MAGTMFVQIKSLSGNGRTRNTSVSLPRIDALLDDRLKYFTLPDAPAPSIEEPSLRRRSGPPPRRYRPEV